MLYFLPKSLPNSPGFSGAGSGACGGAAAGLATGAGADNVIIASLDPQYRCSGSDPSWGNIKGKGPSGLFDYSNVTCLLPAAGAHDGRIRPSVR